MWSGNHITILGKTAKTHTQIPIESGLNHPPVGLHLFVLNGSAPDITFRQIVYGVLPFLVIMVLSIVLLAVFPQIVIWLPDHMYGK